MWYTGQARGYSFIGYAKSDDGLHFMRVIDEPVLISERLWEGMSVMNPCVLYEDGIFKMWYAAGETYEPNVLAYAEATTAFTGKRVESIRFLSEKRAMTMNRTASAAVRFSMSKGLAI